MKQQNILFVPDYSDGNPYQTLLINALKNKHCEVKLKQYPHGLFPLFSLSRQHKNIDVIHIHWITELIQRTQWSSNIIVFYAKCLIAMLDCLLTRVTGTKVVWTIHNKVAHEQLNTTKELFFRRCLAKSVSRIIIHSKEALDVINKLYGFKLNKKTSVIFHGNYNNIYPKANPDSRQLKDKYALDHATPIISYVGMIKPYKGVENLIKAFIKACNNKNNSYLILSGKVATKAYEEELLALIDNHPRIKVNFKFLSEQELVDTLAISDYVCLPFSDTLTSGSTILAMSFNKALILPQNASIFGCVPNDGVHYFNDLNALSNIIENVDKKQAETMGKLNGCEAKEMSWLTVADLTAETYNK